MNFEEIPHEWCCPITQEIMKDPVIAIDGITYERSAIIDWLKKSDESPCRNCVLKDKPLTTNWALKHTIEAYLEAQKNKNQKPQVHQKLPQEQTITKFENMNLSQKSQQSEQYSVNQNVQQKEYAKPMEMYQQQINQSFDKSVSLQSQMYSYNSKSYLHVKLVPQATGKVVPTVFICLIDVSGSMETETTVGENQKEQHGFSRLDLVKHSLKTIISSLQEQHYISIVAFSDAADVILYPQQLNAFGRKNANEQVDKLEPTNATNIWDALRVGIEIANYPQWKDKNVSLLLLTDGQPNVNPPRGIIQTLQKYLISHPFRGNINTFGYGYDLDSYLLHQIAEIGQGQFCFIPDASMVGTIFINFVSNQLSIYLINQQVVIESIDDKSFLTIEKMGAIQYGQSKDFLYEVKNKAFRIKYGNITQEVSQISMIDNNFYYQLTRQRIIQSIKSCLEIENRSTQNNIYKKNQELDYTYQNLKPICKNKECQALLDDLNSNDANLGQITKSISRQDWYEKWGRHYLKSLLDAHQLQITNTFKELGVQLYAGSMFSTFRDQIDDIFVSIKPPKPSVKKKKIQPVQDMSYYYNVGGGCFDGDSQVKLQNGSKKLVNQIKKGDIVFGGKDGYEIICVLKIKINKMIEVVNLSNMYITPWHPVLHNNEWKFPITMKDTEFKYFDYIYNFVCKDGHIIEINDVKVVGLGHNFVDNNVIKHEYLGTHQVIDDLSKMKGWNEGLLNIENYATKINSISGQVQSILQLQQ